MTISQAIIPSYTRADLTQEKVEIFQYYEAKVKRLELSLEQTQKQIRLLKDEIVTEDLQNRLSIVNQQIYEREIFDITMQSSDKIFRAWLEAKKKQNNWKADYIQRKNPENKFINAYKRNEIIQLKDLDSLKREKQQIEERYREKEKQIKLLEAEEKEKQSDKSQAQLSQYQSLDCSNNDLARLDQQTISKKYPQTQGPLEGVPTKNQLGLTCAANTSSLLYTSLSPNHPIISSYDMALNYYKENNLDKGLYLKSGANTCEVFNLTIQKGVCRSRIDIESIAGKERDAIIGILSTMHTGYKFQIPSNEHTLILRFTRDILPHFIQAELISPKYLALEPFFIKLLSDTNLAQSSFIQNQYLDLLFTDAPFELVWKSLQETLSDEQKLQFDINSKDEVRKQYLQDVARKDRIRGLAQQHLISYSPIFQDFIDQISPQCDHNNQTLKDYIKESTMLSSYYHNQVPQLVQNLKLLGDPYETIRSMLAPGCEHEINRDQPQNYRCNSESVLPLSIHEFKGKIINQLINKKRAIGIDFCTGVLQDPTNNAQQSEIGCQNQMYGQAIHAATVIGVRGKPDGKGCQFLVQNSWGPCSSDYSNHWACEDGKIWIDDVALYNNGISLNTIFDK